MSLCRDVAWRKGRERSSIHLLSLLRAEPSACIFVGDDPRWDVAGPLRVGMDAVLLDREGAAQDADLPRIRSLMELPGLLGA